MDLVDANVLLYAVDASSSHHGPAAEWLDAALGGRRPVALPWLSLLAFVRISTNPRASRTPLAVEDAADQVRRWLAAPAALVVEPTDRHAEILLGLLLEAGTGGNLVSDAHLAALAVEHGATVVSYDRDFARFPGVRHRVPGD